jgi:hypothetical protein
MLAGAFERLKGRKSPHPNVYPGAVFRHDAGTAGVETAEVIDVPTDDIGIAHVRFRVRITRGDATFVDEQRTLALSSFCARFRERVDPVASR